ncbi:DUF3955 domain-containing protein [Paenibacillus tritici]|uniref:DUF3955 domain-containing protein n=1 Tax=Paenibacillus tritici TaxID=1873425 RepID=A0ABX2DWU6_9BACL|nr:DUF3955 domain-containing protein [Paenibacillus tritici]NQX47999.1 DUF3955 domain-containing protein [Paenibacillus tritici]
MISRIVDSSVGSDGMLHEPLFFLIPLGFLFLFSGIIALLFVGLGSALNKKKNYRKI